MGARVVSDWGIDMTIEQAIQANPNATDAEILSIVNAPVAKKIDLPTVRQLMAATGTLVSIEKGKAHSNSQIADLCILADKFIYLPFREDIVQLGGDHTQFLTLATSLQQAGIITSETLAGVNALAFDTPTYTLEQVALERSRAARNARAAEWSNVYNDGVEAIDAAWRSGATLPTLAELRAI